MGNNRLNGACILFVDIILNGNEKDRMRKDVRSIKPEAIVKEGRFKTPCCEYLLEHIDHFKEEYDGHIGLGFSVDDEEYFEDFTNCPFCGVPITYAVRKTFKMVPGKGTDLWIKQEVDEN